jgi:hypothetical protein
MALRVHAAKDIRESGGWIINFSLAAVVGRDEEGRLYAGGLERVQNSSGVEIGPIVERERNLAWLSAGLNIDAVRNISE